MQRTGFTLVELMIVVAIIGALSAFAIPSYRAYALRTRVSQSYQALAFLRDRILFAYERDGDWPATITVNGQTLTRNGGWTAYTQGDIVAVNYITKDTGLRLVINIKSIAGVHDSYTDPSSNPTSSHDYSDLETALLLVNQSFQTYCGTWTASAASSIPLAYLPTICTCSNMSQVWADGHNTSSCT